MTLLHTTIAHTQDSRSSVQHHYRDTWVETHRLCHRLGTSPTVFRPVPSPSTQTAPRPTLLHLYRRCLSLHPTHLVPVNRVPYGVHVVGVIVESLTPEDVDPVVCEHRGCAVAQTLVGKVEQLPGVRPAVLAGVVPLPTKYNQRVSTKTRRYCGNEAIRSKPK